MPKVSVIMAVYNTKEDWLREAIESILNQTFSDFEFIIINDGSTNNAEDVILSYKDERIVYIRQENQGLAKSLNNGLKIAKGEYIARMDSDDISLPKRFEKQVKYLDENPKISILGTSINIIPKSKKIIMKQKPKLLDFIEECQLIHPSVMLRKNDLIKYNLKYTEQLSTAEDYDLWSRAVKVLNIRNLQEVFLYYRVEGQGMTSYKKDEGVRNSIIIQQNMLDSITDDKYLQKNIIDTIFKCSKINKTLFEQLFSIKNFRKFNKLYKVITILGFEIKFLKHTFDYSNGGFM